MRLRGRRWRHPAVLRRRRRQRGGHRDATAPPRTTSTRRSTSTATWRTRRRSRSKTRWRDLLLNVETASTVVPDDPESVQRTVAVAFATEKSAVAVHNWVLTNCGVDLGPVATIAPQDPAATTTLAPDVSTSHRPPIVPPSTVPTPTPSPRCRRRHFQRRCHRPTCHRRPVPPVDQTAVDQWISPRRRMTLSTRP